MIIRKVCWLDMDTKEAIVLLSDNILSLWCFSHPFNYNIGNNINEYLYVFEPKNIIISNNRQYFVKRIKHSFSYNIIGELIERNEGILKVGNFLMIIDDFYIPKDIKSGEYIQLFCERIDLW